MRTAHPKKPPEFPPQKKAIPTPALFAWLLCFFLSTAGSVAAQSQPASSFPPLPPAEERLTANSEESDAGAVILEAEISLKGSAKLGWASVKGGILYSHRFRYLVLDQRGAKSLSSHAFFGEFDSTVMNIRGRTISPDGTEFPLDPEKDVRNLDVRDVKGKPLAPVRTAFFPQVAPGAILDLSYDIESKEVPGAEFLALQRSFPIRSLRMRAESKFFAGIYWVPFFLAKVPPKATAKIDSSFNLELDIRDVPAYKEEPYDPPELRMAYYLGLLPTALSRKESPGKAEWYRNAVIFGSPSVTKSLPAPPVSGAINPGDATAQLDELGLQILPSWKSDPQFLKWWQDILKNTTRSFAKFERKSKGAETQAEVTRIAPPELPQGERAKLLFDHARSRVRPEPEADSVRNLAKLLDAGKGNRWDIALYYKYLLDTAGIPSKFLLAFNRYDIAFLPFIESFRVYGVSALVRVEAGNGGLRYTAPGDPFCDFETFPAGYRGSLAFEEPSTPEEPWQLVRLESYGTPQGEMRIAMAAPVPQEGGSVELAVDTKLYRAASYYFRWRLGWKLQTDLEKKRRPFEEWLDRWTNLTLKGAAPEIDNRKELGAPCAFSLKADWTPELVRHGEALVVPLLPKVDLFCNPFSGKDRSRPIWLPGGDYFVEMAWLLPEGGSLDGQPAPSKIEGPSGLGFNLATSFQPLSKQGDSPRAVVSATLHLPDIIPASLYRETQRFFEEVERAVSAKLIIRAKVEKK